MESVSTVPVPEECGESSRSTSLLEVGDHLSASEFLRRYERMPELKKAELVNGIVYMSSPVRSDLHGEPDNLIQTWLGNYSLATPGVKAATNATTRLGPDDVPQPDGLLRIAAECGGQAALDDRGYLRGAPELVVEVAASTASIDLREKLTAYRRAGVREYLVWRTQDAAVDWWVLEDDEYHPLSPDPNGVMRSRTFTGLWLNAPKLIALDGPGVMATLRDGLSSSEHVVFVTELRKRAESGIEP